MFRASEDTINQSLALLIEDEKILSFGRTQSSSPATRVYWTVAFKAFEQALPTFILLTQFKSLKDIRDNPDHGLEKALAILLAATIFSGLNVVWMDWNKLQYRSTPEFDLYWLTKDVEIKPHALYFYLQNDVLHYLIQKDEETLEIKSLNDLDSTTANLIKERKFHELTAAQCDLLKQAVDKHHEPGLKPDATVIAGHTIDYTLVPKCIATQLLISITSGSLLALSLTEGQDAKIQFIAAVFVSTLNFLKNLVTDSIGGINAHILSVSHRANEDEMPTTANLAPLNQQPGYVCIFNPFFIWCLRNIGAPILASFSAGGLFNELVVIMPSLIAGIISFIFYIFATSSLRIFNGVVAKNILEPTISYNIETSFADSTSLCGKVANELLSWRYCTVDYFLQDGYRLKAWSPEIIVNIFIGMIIATALTLIYSPVNDYLLCFEHNCFDAGNGSTLSFLFTSEKLDALADAQPLLFPLLFLFMFSVLGFMAVNVALSQRANILTYLEDRADNLGIGVKRQSSTTRESLHLINYDSQKIVLVNQEGLRQQLLHQEEGDREITLKEFSSALNYSTKVIPSMTSSNWHLREVQKAAVSNIWCCSFMQKAPDQKNCCSILLQNV